MTTHHARPHAYFDPPPPPSNSWFKTSWGQGLIAAGIVGFLAVGVLGWAVILGGFNRTFTANGTFTLYDGEYYSAFDVFGNDCAGDGGYVDIREGANVVIKNSSGKSVAVGELGDSRSSGYGCVFDWVVSEVPKGEGPVPRSRSLTAARLFSPKPT